MNGSTQEPTIQEACAEIAALRTELLAAGKALKRGQTFVRQNCRGYPPQIDRAIEKALWQPHIKRLMEAGR
jgi:hypothetical protein